MPYVPDLSGNSPFTLLDRPVSGVVGISRSYPVTLSDTVDLPNGVCQALSVQVAGTVEVVYANGAEDTVELNAGQWHLMEVKRVKTGGDATGVSAGYVA